MTKDESTPLFVCDTLALHLTLPSIQRRWVSTRRSNFKHFQMLNPKFKHRFKLKKHDIEIQAFLNSSESIMEEQTKWLWGFWKQRLMRGQIYSDILLKLKESIPVLTFTRNYKDLNAEAAKSLFKNRSKWTLLVLEEHLQFQACVRFLFCTLPMW